MRIFTQFKSLMLVAASMFCFNAAFAETENSPVDNITKDTDIVGTSYTLAGQYVAGAAGKYYGDMTGAGVKIRTNKNGNTASFTVNSGYVITGITLIGYGNDAGVDTSVAPIILTSVSVDGAATSVSNVALPSGDNETSVTVALTGIEAKSSIDFAFDNSNVTKNNQWACAYVIEYRSASAGVETTMTETLVVVGSQIYTVAGNRVSSLVPGLNIVKTFYANGTSETKKVYFRQ